MTLLSEPDTAQRAPRGYLGSTTPLDERDEQRTPRPVFEFARRRWDPEIDLAATPENALLPRYLTREEDALSIDWSGLADCGWCNPPYSSVAPWINAAFASRTGFRTVLLLPTPNGERVYHRILQESSEIVYITGRLAFLLPDGRARSGNTRGSCYVVIDSRPGPPIVSVVRREEL